MSARGTKEKFIELALKIERHKNKYDYSFVNYISSTKKVEIICLVCKSDFWQSPSKHLQGHGCPTCGKGASANKRRKSKDQFIAEANLVHSGKYDYSKVNYINNKKKVNIVCKTCGNDFW